MRSCASAASQAATTTPDDRAQTAHIVVVWSVNSGGPDFREILTGTVGDYGSGVTVYPDGAVDPDHTSSLELNLSQHHVCPNCRIHC